MDIPVLIEPLGPDRFRATVFHLSAEAATPDEAKQRVQDLLDERLRSGARLETIRIPMPVWEPEFPHPQAYEDPLYREWLSVIAENRRLADADPDYDGALCSRHRHADALPVETPAGDRSGSSPPG